MSTPIPGLHRLLLAVVACLLALAVSGVDPARAAPFRSAAAARPSVFAYYYLWWSTNHWKDKLGTSYPYSQTPLPLPATLGADGCNAVSLYSGNQLFDVPAALWTQDDGATIERDVRTAASAGLAGFLVNWAGTGSSSQTPTSISYSRRLDAVVAAVRKVNAEGIAFKVWISLKTASSPSTSAIAGDLAYLKRQYGSSSALGRIAGRPVVVWTGSRKYSLSAVKTISGQFRSSFYLVGDETSTSWSDGRAGYLDGDSYYWSSQNPYTNPKSFSQLKTLAAQVRSTKNPDGSSKLWVAPFTPGYNAELLRGGSCVPRKGTETMRRLFEGNAATAPDAWALISWNEIAEGTHVVPLQRWGTVYLNQVRALIGG